MFYLTGDQHYGHSNIIRYCDRPFKDVDEMNRVMIKNHNARVKSDDQIIINGDFCLAPNTYIDTPNGKKQIRNLNVGDKIYSVNLNWNKNNGKEQKALEVSKIVKTFISYSDFRYKIYFENNSCIETTENHPFGVVKKGILYWTLAKNLKINDILFHKKEIPAPFKTDRIEFYKIGYIWGYIRGDGHIPKKNNIDIQSIDYDGLYRIKKYIEKLYKIKLKIKTSKNSKYYRLKISTSVRKSLENFDFFNKEINNYNRDWFRGFIAGFFDAEGACILQQKRNGWTLGFSNTNKKYYDFVVKTIKKFNFKVLHTKPYKPKGKESYKINYVFHIYSSEIYRFFQEFRPAIKRKYPILSVLANGVKIIKIEKIKCKKNQFKNYNLTVEPNNNYFAKGILVHNCFRNSPGGKPGEGLTNRAKFYIDQLNGRKIFVRGSHDKNNSLNTVITSLVIKIGNRECFVVHDPKHINTNYYFNLVAHVHKSWLCKEIIKDKCYAINVGVDVRNFMPVTFDELMKGFYRWLKTKKD